MSKGLTQSYQINASRERVFRALTAADELSKWFVSAAKTDPRAGGRLRYDWKFQESEKDGFQEMEYLDFVENESFSHTWAASGQPTVVRFALNEANGHTEIQLNHDGWEMGMEDAVQMHTEIWAGYMNNLKLYLEEGGDMRGEMMGQITE